MNASWLFERLAGYGDAPALVHRDRAYGYDQVLAQVAKWEQRLAEHAIGNGTVVVVDGGFSPGAVGLVLALVRAGAIVVPTTPLSRTLREKYEEIS